MPRYKYKARNLEGRSIEAVDDAASEDALEKQLAAQGLVLISASSVERRRPVNNRTTLDQTDLIFFTMELSTSFSAGLPLLQTLEDMAASAETLGVRDISRGLSERVSAGNTLSEALAVFPRAFPRLYVELIGAAEATGKLETVLADLVRFLEWQKETRSQIKSATVYPVTMIVAVVGLTLLLTLFVFPKFMSTFASMGSDLPAPTKLLLWMDASFQTHKSIIGLAILAIIGAFILLNRIPATRWYIDMFKLRAPVLGPLQTKLLMSLFTHNLGMMIGSGVDYPSALRLCERIMDNMVFQRIVADARVAVEKGQPLSDAMAKGNLVPSLVRRMLKLGESTGRIEESLENVSKYYDREIPKAIKGMFAILEPMILMAMAGVVLFLAAAIMLPIYGMMAKIGDQ